MIDEKKDYYSEYKEKEKEYQEKLKKGEINFQWAKYVIYAIAAIYSAISLKSLLSCAPTQ